VDYLTRLLGDPAGESRSLASLCIDGDVQPGKLLKLIQDGELSRAQARSLRRAATYLPDVTEDVMKRALPRLVRCPACAGKRASCDVCDGKGRVEKEPSLERQKVALEVGGVLKKGPIVQNTVQQFQGVQVQGLRDFQVTATKALYDRQDVVEAEAAEE
jgi:hypothetical protein